MPAALPARPVLQAPLAFLVTLAMASGCADRPVLVPVIGAVTQKGQPVIAGSVVLHPAEGNAYRKDNPSSLLEQDGSFCFKTFPHGEGVPPGTYTMTLDPALASRLKAAQYARPETSPWKVNVPANGLRELKMEVR